MNSIEEDFWVEIVQIQAESICWIALDEDAYLPMGSDELTIQVVAIRKRGRLMRNNQA